MHGVQDADPGKRLPVGKRRDALTGTPRLHLLFPYSPLLTAFMLFAVLYNVEIGAPR